jgi:hypothetical protein
LTTAVFEPALGLAKRRIGARLGSSATAGEGTQNLVCAYLAIAVFAGLAANTLWGAWWLDGVVALGIAAWAVCRGSPGVGRTIVRLRMPARLAMLIPGRPSAPSAWASRPELRRGGCVLGPIFRARRLAPVGGYSLGSSLAAVEHHLLLSTI